MKIVGLTIGSIALAATASAAGVCDSPDCAACDAASNSALYGCLALVGALVAAPFARETFKKRSGGGIVVMLALLLAVAGNSFAAEKKAADTNAAPTKVTLSELLAKPDAYAGKQVTVKARLADVCASDGCLTLKDKFDVIEGKPPAQGFKKAPRVGTTLNVTGTVAVKGEGEKKDVSIAVTDFKEAKK